MNLVIIGGGHAAAQCIASLRMARFEGSITLISDEDSIPYQRPPLSKAYLLGDLAAERLPILRQSTYDTLGVDVRLNRRAETIDTAAKTVTLSDGNTVQYDKLILATGGRARRLPLPAPELGGIITVRTRADIDSQKMLLDSIGHITIIGAGYIGLEAASALKKLGKDVTVLEAAPRVLARVVAPEVSIFYEDLHRAEGVDLRTGVSLKGYTSERGDGHISHVVLDGAERIATDLVIEGVGMLPNDEIARAAGLPCSDKGILVDAGCRTANPDIYAIGDVTDHENLFLGSRTRLESVQNAVDQAKVATANALGGSAEYHAVPWFWSEQYGLKLQIAGVAASYDRVVTLGNLADRKATFLYMRGDHLMAADCIANTGDFMAAKKAIEQKTPLTTAMLSGAETLKEITAKAV